MSTPAIPRTEFAPASRLDSSRILRQFQELEGEGRITEVLDASPYMAMVTNDTRQVVFANTETRRLLGMETDAIRGKRPGELFACPNSIGLPGGCGTGKNCRYCGLVHVLLEARGRGTRVVREARLFVKKGEKYDPFDVKATATPMTVGDEIFLLVFLDDIGSIKKRERLERAFFHDVMNTAGGVKNLAMYLSETIGPTAGRASAMLVEQSDLLIDEIRSQRLLVDAESDNLAVNPCDTTALVLFTEARTAAEALKESEGKTIVSEPHGADRRMNIDPVLVKRALLNVLKNALEATEVGESIAFGMTVEIDRVTFRVVNGAVMSDEVKSQVFHRSFSTKGPGRGIGTYSMRLIIENYLGGRVSFVSDADTGTVFTVSLPFGRA